MIDKMFEYEGIEIYNFLDFYEYTLTHKQFRIACRFECDLDYEYLFRLIFELKNITLLAEEIELYVNPRTQSSSFLRLVRYGRHRQINIVGIARRASEMSIDFRSQTNRIISFRQTEINDLKIFENIGLHDLDKLGDHNYKEIYY